MQRLPNEILILIFDYCSAVKQAHVLSFVTAGFAHRYRHVRKRLKEEVLLKMECPIQAIRLLGLVYQHDREAAMNYYQWILNSPTLEYMSFVEWKREVVELHPDVVGHRWTVSPIEMAEPEADGWWSEGTVVFDSDMDSLINDL